MVRESYQQQLADLRTDVRDLGREVQQSLSSGLTAIREGHQEMGDRLEEWDDRIDARTADIEHRCTELIALQQPVAGDLRQIISAFKIATDLERVADLAVNLAEYAALSEAFVLLPKDRLLELGELAIEMLEASLEAFQAEDAEKAEAVIRRDKEVDDGCLALRRDVLTKLIEQGEQPHSSDESREIASNTMTVLWSIRDLERVADHAVNICARTIYWLRADVSYI